MNKKELKDKILEAKFPRDSYTLFSNAKDESLCIQHTPPCWLVFYSERGLTTNKKQFSTEEEACDYFFHELSTWFKNRR